MTFADRLEELRKAATPGPWDITEHDVCRHIIAHNQIIAKQAGAIENAELITLLANNADAILELVRAAGEIPEILRNWEPDHSSGLERKKIVAFQSALAKLNGEQT